MKCKLYNNFGYILGQISHELLGYVVGDRIIPLDEYAQIYQVSRGTVQKVFNFLISNKSISIERRGVKGSFLSFIDYKKLQSYSISKDLQGILPLPYTKKHKGLVTALYEQTKSLNFSVVYSRGAIKRMGMVENEICNFAVVSKNAAERGIRNGMDLELFMDFKEGSLASGHVLVLANNKLDFSKKLKVAYDEKSPDQTEIVKKLEEVYNLKKIPLHVENTLEAIDNNYIDIGVWNIDDFNEDRKIEDYNIVEIPNYQAESFTSAVIVIKKNDISLRRVLERYVTVERTLEIAKEVRLSKRIAIY